MTLIKSTQHSDEPTITLPIVFCGRCKSYFVDVYGWINGKAKIECADCGYQGLVEGLTIGRTRNGTPDQLAEAQKDMAKERRANGIISRELKPGIFDLEIDGRCIGRLSNMALIED